MVISTSVRCSLRLVKSYGFKRLNIVSRRPNQFTDSLKLTVTGGHGGNGDPRSRAVGGNGGNVFVEATDEIDNLSQIEEQYPDLKVEADCGGDGKKTRLVGVQGSDRVVKVPCGVTVFNEYLSPISDLVKSGDKTIVAYGGQGGNSRNQYFGIKGQSQLITLDLRYHVDIGLIGFPDSGKTLLMSKLSSSHQKFLTMEKGASYRKRPFLADIKYPDGRLISCIDLPSLVEGAHLKPGLGHNFLKHLTHNQLLLFVIDIQGFNRGIFRKAVETLLLLNKQIEIYDDRFLTKPSVIAVNKMDTENADVLYEEFLFQLKKIYEGDQADLDKDIFPRRLIQYQDIIPISTLRQTNLDYLQRRLRELIDFNYLRARDPDAPRTFASLLKRIRENRLQTKAQLL